MEVIKIPQMTFRKQNRECDCQTCGGTGYLLKKATEVCPDWLEEVYGDRNYPHADDVRVDCPDCKGIRKGGEDLTCCPDNMREADITKFDWNVYKSDVSEAQYIAMGFVNNWREFRQNGKGIYFWSQTPGSGKTFLACCIGKSTMMKNNLKMKFITAPEYIEKCGERIENSKNGVFRDPTLPYFDCDLLILDDIGAQIGRDWQNQELFKLINTRMVDGKVTIYTSNVQADKLNIDERIKSRIIGSTLDVKMPEESIRKKKAEESQNDFLKKLR